MPIQIWKQNTAHCKIRPAKHQIFPDTPNNIGCYNRWSMGTEFRTHWTTTRPDHFPQQNKKIQTATLQKVSNDITGDISTGIKTEQICALLSNRRCKPQNAHPHNSTTHTHVLSIKAKHTHMHRQLVPEEGIFRAGENVNLQILA